MKIIHLNINNIDFNLKNINVNNNLNNMNMDNENNKIELENNIQETNTKIIINTSENMNNNKNIDVIIPIIFLIKNFSCVI